MPTYPQKSVGVNNYHYFYIYVFRVNRYTDFANKQPLPEPFCLHQTKTPVACISAVSATFDHRPFLMASLAIAVVVSQFHASYVERELAVQSQTEHYVKAMEAHVIYSIQSVDLSLIGFANAIKVLPAKQSQSPETMSDLLSSRGSNFNSDYWITFIDPKATPSPLPPAPTFLVPPMPIAITSGPRQQFHQRQAVHWRASIGKISKNGCFSESPCGKCERRVPGVVVAPINVERYVKVFENSRFNSDISITLVHGGGKIIARVPNFEQAFGRDLGPSALFDNVRNASSGTYKTVSIIDNVVRIFSYRVIDELPLIMVVGSNDTESARLLQQNYLVAGGGLTILLLLMMAPAIFPAHLQPAGRTRTSLSHLVQRQP
jgi:hypothetical protein